jgi:hypothetical protein
MGLWLLTLATLASAGLMGANGKEIWIGQGLLSLESAIGNATQGDILRIQAGIYGGAGFCGIAVHVSVSILGEQQVVIDCGGNSRALDIHAPVTVEGIIFRNGHNEGEGALEPPLEGNFLTIMPPHFVPLLCRIVDYFFSGSYV